MAQSDGVVSNGSGAAVRADINVQLGALWSNHSGSSEPSTKYAYMFWADTTANQLKIRNSANSAWGVISSLNGGVDVDMADGTASAPGLAFASDVNTGLYKQAADAIGFATNGTHRFLVGGSLSTNDGGPSLLWKTFANPGTTSNTGNEGLQITQRGTVNIGMNGTVCMNLNKIDTAAGHLLNFKQAGVEQGFININGSTVSLVGAHLARLTQKPGGASRSEILRGTLLTNIDEMCEWTGEQNMQLNRMEISSVEGDPSVAGVFEAWDDEDPEYPNDLTCAMTGDFVLRIAEAVTVARGDLLMSAGDGTAKPQGDDIVRSKTVAKVTSTFTTTTYSDGSYCVPCVLMAC